MKRETIPRPPPYLPIAQGKDCAADIIKHRLPDLTKRTTFLWVGMFASNLWNAGLMNSISLPGSQGSHIFLAPVSSETQLYNAGDESHNTGVFVSAILRKPKVSLPAKYAFVYTERVSFQEYLQPRNDVTGRRETFVQVSVEQYEELWGPFGKELALMFEAFEKQPDWSVAAKDEVVTAEDLGIASEELLGTRAALEKNRDKL